MEKVLKVWASARSTLRKGIEDLVNTKLLQVFIIMPSLSLHVSQDLAS